jgi:7-carboxy-7-deazaguanine synthase
MSLEEIIKKVDEECIRLVEITGGEPLLQEIDMSNLVKRLLDSNYRVLIETNGSLSIKSLDNRATVIVDIKTPGSGMSDKMDLTNFDYLKPTDEIKFVICDRKDYDWSKKIIMDNNLVDRCTILFSPAFDIMSPEMLANWIIKEKLDVRLNIQLHKYIYGKERRSV